MSDTVFTDTPPDCDFCEDGTKAKYDAVTKHGGRWANMCEKHMKEHGRYAPNQLGTGKGQEFKPLSEKPAPVIRDAEDLDIEDLEEMILGDSNASTSCPHGCEVEPDGTCPHGYRSHLLELGFI